MTIPASVLNVALVERFVPAEVVPYEPGHRISAAANQVDFYMIENFHERYLTVVLEPELRHMDGAITARAIFSTGDLLYEEIPGGEVSDFATVPPGSYGVHLEATEPEDSPARYVITLFDHRPIAAV